MTTNHTVWTASQELNIDHLHNGGRKLSILDLLSDGDDFLQFPAEIVDGNILVLGVMWKECDEYATVQDLIKQTLSEIEVCYSIDNESVLNIDCDKKPSDLSTYKQGKVPQGIIHTNNQNKKLRYLVTTNKNLDGTELH